MNFLLPVELGFSKLLEKVVNVLMSKTLTYACISVYLRIVRESFEEYFVYVLVKTRKTRPMT